MNYNDPLISKQKSMRHMQREAPIKVGEDRICRKNNDQCYYTGINNVCLKCAISFGDTRNDIMFRPSSWIPPKPLETLIEKVSLSEEEQHKIWKKHNPIMPEEPVIIQAKPMHSERIKHQVYVITLGTNCSVCNFPVYGVNYCPGCSMIIEE